MNKCARKLMGNNNSTLTYEQNRLRIWTDQYKYNARIQHINLQVVNQIQIEKEAFYGAVLLKKLEITCKYLNVSTKAFCGCSELSSINLNVFDTLELGELAFANTKLFSVEFPDCKLLITGPSVFSNCKHLNRIVIPSNDLMNAVLLSNNTFNGCGNVIACVTTHHVFTVNGTYTHYEWLQQPEENTLVYRYIRNDVEKIEHSTFLSDSTISLNKNLLNNFYNMLKKQTLIDAARPPVQDFWDIDFYDSQQNENISNEQSPSDNEQTSSSVCSSDDESIDLLKQNDSDEGSSYESVATIIC